MGRFCVELRTDSPKLGGEKRNPQPTHRSNRVGWFRTSTGGRRVGWIRDGEKRWKKHKSNENLTGFDEILPDPVKISSNLREIAPEFGKISPGFWFFHQFLENFGRNLEIFQSVQVFRVLREENWNPTCRNRFLVMKTPRRPAGVVGSANFGLDLVGSSGGSGTRMNLDSPKNNT